MSAGDLISRRMAELDGEMARQREGMINADRNGRLLEGRLALVRANAALHEKAALAKMLAVAI